MVDALMRTEAQAGSFTYTLGGNNGDCVGRSSCGRCWWEKIKHIQQTSVLFDWV
jgi:hypothetical protein